jgi:ankyrin repeat protein
MLERGANPNMQLKLNPGYRHTKDDRGSDQMLHTIGATPLLRAAKAFDTPAIELLLAHGALIDLPNDRGMLPILAAAGATSRVADTRGYFDTPDVQQRSIEALTALIAAGADVNAADPSGQTAVFSAAQWGWNDVVSFLAENGARLDVTDAAGRTPYDAAMGVRAGGAPGPVNESTAALIEELARSQAADAGAAEEDPA